MVGLDRAAFDHGFTDYALHGAHARVACESCHRPGVAFREAPADCVACHREDDVHRGELGTDCARCHEESSWSEARFDHDETDFPLVGEHRSVACALCHPSGRYEDTTTDCNGCHRLNDSHLGRFGPDCESCHSAHGWKPARFDHARDAGLALKGGVLMIDTDAGPATAAAVVADQSDDDQLQVNLPQGGTAIEMYCDGTYWIVSGVVLSTAAAAFS